MNLSSASPELIKEYITTNKDKAKEFECTASYGNLYIDSMHNMFCISRKQNSGGGPAEFGYIWYIYDCEETGIFCSDIKNIGKDSNFVVCSVILRVKERGKIPSDFVVVKQENCTFKPSKKDSSVLECKEPEKLSMFRFMFNQMVENEIFAMARKLDYLNELRTAALIAKQEYKNEQEGTKNND